VFKLVIDPVAEEQIAALPDHALHPLADLFALLEAAPWSGEAYDSKNPRANMLTHPFGERGLATYVVLDRQGEVYLVRIEWP
jgi:hypothetical protein